MDETRIALLTYGTRGDAQPIIALGAGLHAGRLSRPAGRTGAIRSPCHSSPSNQIALRVEG